MHWTLTVIGFAVAWALLGGLWRPGSIALAASWMAGQAFYVGTGNALPLALYAVLDPLVLYAIWRWHSSRLDWFIMASFPFQWATYVMATGAAQWFANRVSWCSTGAAQRSARRAQGLRFKV